MPISQLKRDPWALATIAWCVVAMAYVFFIPVGNNLLLYPLILSFAVLAGVNIIKNRLRVDRSFLLPAALWAAFVILGVVTAIAREAESWQRTLVFFLVWPAIFSVVVVGFDRRLVRVMFTVGAWVTVLIGVVFLVEGLILSGRLPAGVIPAWLARPILLRGVTDGTGMIALSASSLPPLIWWGAMWIASMFCDPRDRFLPPVWLRTLAATLAVVGAVASWRRAIVIVLVAAPVIAVVMLVALKFRNARGDSPAFSGRAFLRLGVVAVIALALSLVAQPHFVSMFGSAVGSSTKIVEGQAPRLPTKNLPKVSTHLTVAADNALADEIRKNESQNLLTAHSAADWIVGRGFGATIDRGGVVRDMKPWQTELQYHAIFYWTGLIGVALVLAVAFTSLRALRKAFRVDDPLRASLFVSSAGAIAALVADATNPYLQAPGHLWPVFFPFMIASAILGTRARAEQSAPTSELVEQAG